MLPPYCAKTFYCTKKVVRISAANNAKFDFIFLKKTCLLFLQYSLKLATFGGKQQKQRFERNKSGIKVSSYKRAENSVQ